MAFIESPRFPEKIALNASGGPEFSTSVVVVYSGQESRNSNWEYARGRWDVGHRNKSKADFDLVANFFRTCKGRLHSFRFKDHVDYQVAITEGLLETGIGTGAPSYQMYKKYTSGAQSDVRKISKPVSGTCTFKRGGSTLTVGVGAGNISVDYTTGIVTFVADASSNASSVTPGATTQVVLAANPGTLIAGQKLYLTGFTGADAALLNNLAHTINSVSGAGPYTFTLATNTSGKTITVGSGAGKKYPQATEALTWSGEFDVPARFDTDRLDAEIIGPGPILSWGSIPIVEVRT